MVLAVPLALMLSGCASLASLGNQLSVGLFGHPETYYTDPKSPGYAEPHFGGLCEVCGRPFYFSAAHWDTGTATCPYDGHSQDLAMAHNRFNYEQEQAQAQRGRAMAMQFLQMQTAQNQARQQCINNCRAMSVAQQAGTLNVYSTPYTSYPACQAACQ